MARRDATGQLVERRGKHGVTFGLRFRAADGSRVYETLGRSQDGVARREAEIRAEQVLARVRLGQHTTRRERAREAAERAAQRDAIPVFAEFVEAWLERRLVLGGQGQGLSESGRADLRWRVDHLVAWFGGLTLAAIDEAEVERYAAAKRGAPIRQGGLGATSVNKTLSTLTAVLAVAVRYRHTDRNLAADFRLPTTKYRAPHLTTAAQIIGLLDAAGTLDAAGRTRRGHGRPLLATLVFGGLRIDEALSLRWRDVNLADGVLHVRSSKTDAGIRGVDVLPVLRDELASLKAMRHPERDAFVFGTATGRKDGATNIRRRVLARAVALANERLREKGTDEIPERLTPHGLRHTFASVLVALGEDPGFVMDQMGHTDPNFTLRVCRKAMSRRDGERERLAALVRGEPSRDIRMRMTLVRPSGHRRRDGPCRRRRVAHETG